jgi:hypothetical protein
MEKVNQLIETASSWMSNAGIPWKIFVTLFFILAVLVWMDFILGNNIRLKAKSLIGILFESAANWYVLKKNIAKAHGLHIATRRQYHVIPLSGSYHVLNNLQRKRINRLLSKYNMIININDLLKMAIYSTK